MTIKVKKEGQREKIEDEVKEIKRKRGEKSEMVSEMSESRGQAQKFGQQR